MDNKNVSATQILDCADALEASIGQQGQMVSSLNSSMQAAKNDLKAMMAQDGAIISQRFFSRKDPDGKVHHFVETWYYELVVDGNLDEIMKAYDDFDAAYGEYQASVEKLNNKIAELRDSANVIEEQTQGIVNAMAPGNTDAGGSSSQSPENTKPEKEEDEDKDKKDKEDYGNEDEGEETEPTVPNTIPNTIPTIPTATTQTPSTTTNTPTTNQSTQTTTAPTSPTTSESHSGGGYGAGGYSYNATDENNENDETLDASASIDSILKGKELSKIPTSSSPIARVSRSKSSGGSAIPITSGIASAAVLGLGAKAYLDKKRKQEDEEEEEDGEVEDILFI